MKKAACFLLAAALALAALTGCEQKKEKSAFEADNEILTYKKIDPAKTQLTVARVGNISIWKLCNAFEEQNPDVQVVFLDITGGNEGCRPASEWITRGYAPDVMMVAEGLFSDELTEKHFMNLSASPFTQNYEAAALKRTAVNAEVYWLPGPSNINAMMYNKTLFAQYGWEVPATFDQFVALCEQITADTGGEVQPWNPNAKYSNELMTVLEGMTYGQLFGGVENRAWYDDFNAGRATFAGHMEPYLQAVQTLADRHILLPEHFSYSATARGKELAAGKIAMINVNIYDADNDLYDFGYMPFPATDGELGYLCDNYSCYVGLPVKERTEKQLDAANRFLAFFSSEEGQRVYIGNSMKVSNVKNVPLNQSDDLAALQPAIDAGHLFARLDFASTASPTAHPGMKLWDFAAAIVNGEATVADCVAAADRPGAEVAAQAAAEGPEVVAMVEKDMTTLETSFYIADLYREATGADVGLLAHGGAYRGNLTRLFQGEVTPAVITVLKPRSFANGSALVKLSMTGRQLLDALNNPVGEGRTEDCLYAYSGLKCKLAPWNELGRKYISVALADGTALDEAKLYAVGAWEGTIAEEYVTEVLERYEGSWEDWMTAKMKADRVIAPATDGRGEIVWE